ncbi:hypothetical protein ID866_5323 [Astraeus odoratus]|nr:hypothetical protein ID866_5323 [Astraeus odoratus]
MPMSPPPPYSERGWFRHTYFSDTTDSSTDFERISWKQKPIAGPEFYDRSRLSRIVALGGLFVSFLFGSGCIYGGVKIFLSKNSVSSGVVVVSLGHAWQRELISLGFSLLVTMCTEATGFVHNIALRAALSSERRLRFNANLRLLSAASGLFSPNGIICNMMMSLLLVVSYSSGILVTLAVDTDSNVQICVSDIPLIVLGVCVLLQVIISFAGMASADIMTWSSSPFDITAALVHHAQVIPVADKCMHGVKDMDLQPGPAYPRAKQPSALGAHSSVRKVITTLWVLVVACVVWGLVVARISAGNIGNAFSSWSFFSDQQSYVTPYTIHLASGGAEISWAAYYVSMALVQGPMTLGLHCSELVVNVVRDEKVWRCATRKKGAKVSTYPLAPVFGSWLNILLLVAKPVLHWMLGLGMSLAGAATGGFLTAISVSMYPMQIMNLTAVLFIFSLILTIVALYSPRGPQPAAYGHVQTLANLVDEWSPVMWWGDKTGSVWTQVRHAGTHDSPLPLVQMDGLYA